MESIIVIYDNVGTVYYLIFHDTQKGWILPKTEIEDGDTVEENLLGFVRQSTGLNQLKITSKHPEMPVYLVESSMNIPVILSQPGFDTYLWSTYDRVMEKLDNEPDRQVISESQRIITSS